MENMAYFSAFSGNISMVQLLAEIKDYIKE